MVAKWPNKLVVGAPYLPYRKDKKLMYARTKKEVTETETDYMAETAEERNKLYFPHVDPSAVLQLKRQRSRSPEIKTTSGKGRRKRIKITAFAGAPANDIKVT